MSFLYTFHKHPTAKFLHNKEMFNKANQQTYYVVGYAPGNMHCWPSIVLQDKNTGNTHHRGVDENWEMFEIREVRRGKLIFIEGVDSVGKATQTHMLQKRLENEGYNVKTFTYPNYEGEYGKLIKHYLNGGYGPAETIDAKLAGSLYTLDRMCQKEELEEYLDMGYIVICDRSPYSNAAFQGAKENLWTRRLPIFEWFVKMEFEALGLPKPDLAFFLDGHPDDVAPLLDKRKDSGSVAKDGGKDQHEANRQLLINAYELYEHASLKPPFLSVACIKDDKLRPRADVHNNIYNAVRTELDNGKISPKAERDEIVAAAQVMRAMNNAGAHSEAIQQTRQRCIEDVMQPIRPMGYDKSLVKKTN